jgi:glycosyltransferase involved in cell wall biosynthesis
MAGVAVLISVDTEEDNWGRERTGVSVANIRELPRFQALCERLGARPTYFTTYQVGAVPWAAGLLRDLAADGRAEVAAHLHPWNTPPLDEPFVPRNSMTKNLPPELQHAKIATLTRALEEAFGRRPTSFRAGRYGLGRETTQALIAQGYRVDSSVTPWVSWVDSDDGADFVGAPLSIYDLDGTTDPRVAVPGGPLVEVPLSCGYTRWPFERWAAVYGWLAGGWPRRLRAVGIAARAGLVRRVVLSPEISPPADMLRLARQLVSHGVTHVHLTLHSPTLRPGLSPFAASRRDVERVLAWTERFVDGLARAMPVTFATVAEAAGAVGAAAGAGGASSARRAVPLDVRAPGRLLVVSYHYPPDGAVGGLRWAGFSKYLARLGWDVHVLTGSAATAPGLKDGVQVHVCPRRFTLNDAYNRLASRARRTLGRTPGAAAPQGGDGTMVPASPSVRRRLASLLGFPDQSRGWMLRATRRARELIRRVEPDVVVTSGPPHTAHVVGARACAAERVPLVVDFRDPWFTELYASGIARALARRLERRVFAVAREAIGNTPELADGIAARFPARRVTWVRNGVDPELLEVEPLRESGLTIVHAGTLYIRRNLGPVLRAFRALLDRHPGIGPSEARVRVAGHLDEGRRADLRAQMRDLGLEAYVHVAGVVSRAEALRLAAGSSASIVLAQDQKAMIPAKLYELVAMRVPTIVLTEADSASAREAGRVGAYVVAPDDVAGLTDLFEALWQGCAPAPPSAGEPYSYDALAERMSRLLAAPVPA